MRSCSKPSPVSAPSTFSSFTSPATAPLLPFRFLSSRMCGRDWGCCCDEPARCRPVRPRPWLAVEPITSWCCSSDRAPDRAPPKPAGTLTRCSSPASSSSTSSASSSSSCLARAACSRRPLPATLCCRCWPSDVTASAMASSPPPPPVALTFPRMLLAPAPAPALANDDSFATPPPPPPLPPTPSPRSRPRPTPARSSALAPPLPTAAAAAAAAARCRSCPWMPLSFACSFPSLALAPLPLLRALRSPRPPPPLLPPPLPPLPPPPSPRHGKQQRNSLALAFRLGLAPAGWLGRRSPLARSSSSLHSSWPVPSLASTFVGSPASSSASPSSSSCSAWRPCASRMAATVRERLPTRPLVLRFSGAGS
uniref:Uncharacterized protein n=1 Tax=Anopheles atroparvus TaxID=41427 RepID=A0A182IJF6_ANOAO